jgi:hypothetical protein
MIMSTEHLSEEQIAQCADAMAMEEYSRITPAMKAHLAECDQCAEEVNATAQIVRQNFSQSLSSALQEVKYGRKSSAWWIGAAAALVLLFALGYIFKGNLFPNQNQIAEDPNPTTINIDTNAAQVAEVPASDQTINPIAIDTQKIQQQQSDENAIAFQNNTELDLLVARYAEGALRGDDVEIFTPSKYKATLETIELKWQSDEESYLTIEIFDNQGKQIESIQSKANTYSPKQISKAGVYYWKLINEDFDMLFCGKIEVNP